MSVILSVTINLSTVSFIGAYRLLGFALFTAGCLIGRMFIEEILIRIGNISKK